MTLFKKEEKKIMCPLCFVRYPLTEVEYFCNCKKEKLEEQANNATDLNTQRELRDKVAKTEPTIIKYKKGSVKCSENDCNKNLDRYAIRCPKCKKTLPEILFEEKIEQLPFALIGTSGAGKTVYMHLMLREMNNTNNLKLTIEHIGVETINMHDKVLAEIKEGKKPEATKEVDVESSMWTVKNGNDEGKNKIKTYFFNIFDGAGESQERSKGSFEQLSEKDKAYILSSEAIIFVVDPLKLNNFENILDPGESDFSKRNVVDEYDPAVLIKKIAEGIRKDKKLGSNYIIDDMDIAVVFTKMDLFWEKLNPVQPRKDRFTENQLSLDTMVKKSPHADLGYFDYSDCDAVHENMIKFLEKYGNSFLNALFNCFAKNKCKLFGVSSTGSPPPSLKNLPSNIKPHRVLDPILWLLVRNGIINGI